MAVSNSDTDDCVFTDRVATPTIVIDRDVDDLEEATYEDVNMDDPDMAEKMKNFSIRKQTSYRCIIHTFDL